MVVIVDTSNLPGSHPLPRLEDFLVALLRLVVPEPKSFAWDAAKLEEIKKKFKPTKYANGGGCMEACYKVLNVLYGDTVAKALQKEIWDRALAKAKAYARAHPKELEEKARKLQEANPDLTDAQARNLVINQWTSPFNTSDHIFELMRENGMAGEKVNVPNKDAEQAIRDMTGNAPGVFFYGMAVNDNHTVTLAVERADDGTQKMYWLDQQKPGLGIPIDPGKLGESLNGVFGHTETTNIYAYRPPAGKP